MPEKCCEKSPWLAHDPRMYPSRGTLYACINTYTHNTHTHTLYISLYYIYMFYEIMCIYIYISHYIYINICRSIYACANAYASVKNSAYCWVISTSTCSHSMFNRWSRWPLARGIEVVSTHHLGMAMSCMHMSYQSIIIYIYICISQISDIYVLVGTNYIQHSLYSAHHYPNIPTTTISTKHQQMYLQLWQRHQQVLLSSVQGIPKDIAMAVEGQPILTSHWRVNILGRTRTATGVVASTWGF